MKIRWLGHACFLIEGEGRKFLIDPFEPFAFGGRIGHTGYDKEVDFVVSTHEHKDHFHLSESFGNPVVVRNGGLFNGVEFFSMPVPHDNCGGSERGFVNLFAFSVEGIRICHPGDIGCLLSSVEYRKIGRIDILFVPVGGFFTIGAEKAHVFVQALSPRIVVPMHFKYEKIDLPIAGVDAFLRGRSYKEHRTGSMDIESGSLPAETEIHLLAPPL